MKTIEAGTPVRFPANDAEIGGELFTSSLSHAPGLVLIPDVRGISSLYRGLARRLAADGFTTLVIDIYSREGTPDLPDMDAVLRCIAELPDQRVLGDVAAAVRFLAGRSDVRADRIGIVGFCLGGQYALMAACQVPELAACVSFYGMLRHASRPAHKPASPLDLAPQLGCPLLGLFGAEDPMIPNQDVDELREILARHGKSSDLITFEGAGHAFMNDARPDAYRPEAARIAWEKATRFLRETLG